MKKLTAILISLFLIPIPVVFAECDSWYFNRTGGQVPPIAKEFSYLEDYGGYYVDRNAKEDDKVIYLTFDAGYENGNVSKVVDTLEAHGVHGTFFILENLAKREPDLVKRMAAGGHTVANHSATHPDLSHSTKEQISAELSRLEECVRCETGVEVAKIFRPPEGKLTKNTLECVNSLGYKTVMWSFAYADWDNERQPDPEKSVEKILSNTHNGMVLLLHPTSATNAQILDTLLCEWEKAGYRIGDISELIKD